MSEDHIGVQINGVLYVKFEDAKKLREGWDKADAEIEKLRVTLQTTRRDALEEAARRVEMMWLRFREKDEGTSDWIFQKYDDIPTGDDFVAAIRALGEKE